MTGSIKRIVADKGFGFVADEATADEYFFHRSDVKGKPFEALQVGDRVRFDGGQTPKGLRASAVQA